jgi:hypothetical protein
MLRSKSGRNAQGGFSVMLALVIIALAIGSLAVTFLSTFGTKARSDRVTEAALAKAKEALIAYAATDTNRPGELPCPDIDNDGQLSLGVDFGGGGVCTAYIGRLPWMTLGIGDLRDGSGERLWYAVSKDFRAGGSVALNSDTPGQLTVTGITPASSAVAILFAPGDALPGQDRTNKNSATGYLEGVNAVSNANTTTTFTTENASTTFNDRLITIRPAEIFRLVEKRVVRELRPLINQYYTDWNRYPFAAPFANPATTYAAGYKGMASTDDGLLPVTHGNTNFVTWNGPASSITAGIIPLSNCTSATGQVLTCTAVAVSLLTVGSQVTVTAYADNVGMAFVDPVPIGDIQVCQAVLPILPCTTGSLTSMLDDSTFNQALDANGRGVVTITGKTKADISLGYITVQIARPPQYSSWVTASSPPTAWIMNNDWPHVIYYASAPGMTPDGPNTCVPTVNACGSPPTIPTVPGNACLTVCDTAFGVVTNNVKVLLVTTGAALPDKPAPPACTPPPTFTPTNSHPSVLLWDYLDDGNFPPLPRAASPQCIPSSVWDLTYESKPPTAVFNDQVFVVSP